MRKSLFACLALAGAYSMAGTAGASSNGANIANYSNCGGTISAGFTSCRLGPRWGEPGQWNGSRTFNTTSVATAQHPVYVRAAIPQGARQLKDKVGYRVQFRAATHGNTTESTANIAVRMWLSDASGQRTVEVKSGEMMFNAGKWTTVAYGKCGSDLGFEPAFIYASITPTPAYDFDGTVIPTHPAVAINALHMSVSPCD